VKALENSTDHHALEKKPRQPKLKPPRALGISGQIDQENRKGMGCRLFSGNELLSLQLSSPYNMVQ